MVWIVTLFRMPEAVIRYRGYDTVFGAGYGEIFFERYRVPEQHFDYWWHFEPYHEDYRPTISEHLFGNLPYPTLTLKGGGLPFWNIVVILLLAPYLRKLHAAGRS